MGTFNVDEYLKSNTLTVTLNGKTFKVKDVPKEVRMMLEEGADEAETVKKILSCTDADLEGYGLAAFSAIIREVTENLFPEPSPRNQ